MLVRMMERVPSAASSPEEYCPKQSQQGNPSYRSDNNDTVEGGRIGDPPRRQHSLCFCVGQEERI
jgi:hypothetical protein